MVYFGNNEPVNLITSSRALDALMLEDYPGIITWKQRKDESLDKRSRCFSYNRLEKATLLSFLRGINNKIGDAFYVVSKHFSGEPVIIRHTDGSIENIEV